MALPQVPFHLRYDLNRRQRLVPHVAIWGPVGLIGVGAVAGPLYLAVFASPWWAFVAFVLLWIFRRFFVGILDVVIHPVRHMDVVVEENGLGFLIGRERWYIFLDGILDIRKFRKDTWTIQHFNGTVIHVLASAITDEQIDYLKAAAERGRDPEVIKAVIERGRRIQEILDEERRNK